MERDLTESSRLEVPTMSDKLERLKGLLWELFQLDQPDLDFGIYRIMHAKSAEVGQFLDQDLLPQVRRAFEQYQPASRAEIQRELDEVTANVRNAGMDPDQSPRVQELRHKLAEEAVDLDQLEAEVYDHLYHFFRRYYSEGDFLAKRVYKPGVYAIPYEGEEVKLHWANKDQYYIKTSETLRDYAFRLKPHDERNPMRVHFKLVDATEGEHGNVRATNERRFILTRGGESGRDFIGVADGELVIRFEYRPATLSDWPEDRRAEEEARSNPRPPDQADLIDLAAARVLAVDDETLRPWLAELGRRHIKADGSEADYSRLIGHLKRYAARNTFDYFIHKDLGGFLRRELDFFIKNEIMHLDDIESETAPRVEQYLSKIRVIRSIAHKIIDFLAQLEDFQKKLWLKKKFVVETNYCITLDLIPEEFYSEIAANEAQREEWVRLFSINDITGGHLGEVAYSEPLSVDFLIANRGLILSTRHFRQAFVDQVLSAIDSLGGCINGILIHSENFQALCLMRRRYRASLRCIYIDPPFNSPSSEIVYKNNYKHSTFLSLMQNRLLAAQPLSTADGSCVVAIDENEGNALLRLIHEMYPGYDVVNVAVEHNKKGIQGDHFSYTNEFAIFVVPMTLKSLNRTELPQDEWEYANLRNWGGESLRTDGANCFYPIYVRDGSVVGFGDVCGDEFHPAASNVEHEDGITAVYPIDAEGVERKWRYARDTVEGILPLLKVDTARNGALQIMKAKADAQFKTIWSHPRYNAGDYGTKILTNMGVPKEAFDFPKSLFTVRDSIFAVSGRDDTILDYFAGSGTTAHAVMSLNREDGGSRKYILVEMGTYFDDVTKPRVLKSCYAPEWRDGKPTERNQSLSHVVKELRLETYEDALNNLDMTRTERQQDLLAMADTRGPNGLGEEYLLRYMLDVETRGSQSLLNVDGFIDPTAYKLKVKRPGGDETREVNVDLLETFNWLIGLTVQHIAAPQTLAAEFERDGEGRLQIRGRLRPADDGPYWFRTVTGTTPDGRKTLVIWRKRPGGEDPAGIEQDNLVLNEWFSKSGYSTRDYEFDLIYVNGDNNLENLKTPDDTWKVRLIEEDFHRLMFDVDDV
jgi:adenine-specific DNA-methyltransferase